MTLIKLSLGLAVVGTALASCSPEEPPSSSPPGAGTGGLAGAPSANGRLGGADAPAPSDELQDCATATVAAEERPVYLVFMFDRSGSMTAEGSPKWPSATAASKAFFEAAESKGVHASLAFFPDKDSYSCEAGAYRTPNVSMTALPSAALGASLDAQTPGGATPTRAALAGAIAYAEDVAANEAKGGNVAVVLVTDGLPDSSCADESVAAVKNLAATAAGTIPTYVIGVGDQLTTLQDIAVGGGTKNAFIVSAGAPEQIRQDFLQAITAIKRAAVACDYEIPPPPAGAQLDRDKVNVVFSSDAGADTFSYDPQCSGERGWRYDDADAPTRIVLCDASCEAVKAKTGRMEVVFGCSTRTVVVK